MKNCLLTLFVALILSAASFAQINNAPSANPPYWGPCCGVSGTVSFVLNAARLWEVWIPYAITSTTLSYSVQTADNTADLYNIAITDASGNILCQTGAVAGTTFAATTGDKNIAWSGGTCTISAAGKYYIAMTGNAVTAVLKANINQFVPLSAGTPTANSTTASGVFTSPLTPPADSWGANNIPAIMLR